MHIGQTSHRWFFGGALAAIALLALGWVLLITPEHGRADSLRTQTGTVEAQLPTLQHRLSELRQQSGDQSQYLAELAKDRAALPSSAAMADFLRELQSGGDSRGATVVGMVVGAPAPVSAAGANYFAVPVTLKVQGTLDALQDFLNQLQQVQPRAVLINDAELDAKTSGKAPPQLSLAAEIFVSATAPAPTPSATPSASS